MGHGTGHGTGWGRGTGMGTGHGTGTGTAYRAVSSVGTMICENSAESEICASSLRIVSVHSAHLCFSWSKTYSKTDASPSGKNLAHVACASPKTPSTCSYPRGGLPAAQSRRNLSNLGRDGPSMTPPTDQTRAKRKRFSTHSGSSFSPATDGAFSASRSCGMSASKRRISPRTRVTSSVAGRPTESVALHSRLVKRMQGGTSQPKRLRSLGACGSSGGGSVVSHEVSSGSQPIWLGST